MAWIKIVDQQEATGHLAAYYEEVDSQSRRIVDAHSLLSLNPGAMRAIDAFCRPSAKVGHIWA